MDAFVRLKNPNAPKVAEHFIELGKKLGIRGDIAFCQSIKETGWFKFSGDVTADQNNYCGLGTTGGGVKGAKFDTPRDGVLAQLQHLWAYATKNSLPAGEKLIDPRFHLVTKGVAPYWEDLAGRWAVPGFNRNTHASLQSAFQDGKTYGQEILAIYEDMKRFTPPTSPSIGDKNKPKPEQSTKVESVLYTYAKINNTTIPSVVIDGKGFISVSEIADLLGKKALYDKLEKIIVIVEE